MTLVLSVSPVAVMWAIGGLVAASGLISVVLAELWDEDAAEKDKAEAASRPKRTSRDAHEGAVDRRRPAFSEAASQPPTGAASADMLRSGRPSLDRVEPDFEPLGAAFELSDYSDRQDQRDQALG